MIAAVDNFTGVAILGSLRSYGSGAALGKLIPERFLPTGTPMQPGGHSS
jgi:hypothetical protein